MAITDVKGIGPATVGILAEHGIRSAADLAATNLAKLITVPGFSRLRAQQVIRDAKALLRMTQSAPATSIPVPETKTAPAKQKSGKKSKKAEKDKKSGKKAKSKKEDKRKKAANKLTKGKKSKKK